MKKSFLLLYFALLVTIGLGGISFFGYSQISQGHPKPKNCNCIPPSNCIVANDYFAYVNPSYSDTDYSLPVVPDTVCRWNHRMQNPADWAQHELFWQQDPPLYTRLVRSDPDFAWDSIQIFQQLPTNYVTDSDYTFSIHYALDNDNELHPNFEMIVCLTNQDPLTHYAPFSDQLLIYNPHNLDSGIYIYTRHDVHIDRHYDYIVLCWVDATDSANRSFWLDLYSVDLCAPQPFQIEAGKDTTICINDSIQLGGNPTAQGGVPAYTYYWSINPPSVFDSTSSNPWVHPTITIKYYLVVHDRIFEYLRDSVIITVNPCYPKLFADAGKDLTPCNGDGVQLGGAHPASGGVPPYTYSWTSIPPGFTSSEPHPVVHPYGEIYYILTVIDSVNQVKRDTAIVKAVKCFGWPRKIIAPVIEDMKISCDSVGDVLATFCVDNGTYVELFHDTIFNKPRDFYDVLVFFDKFGNRLWFQALDAFNSCVIHESLVDNERNSYILFSSQRGYSFYNGPSLVLDDTRQFLAKIDIHGVVKWVQTFSTPLQSFYLPVQSFCKYGDSIYLTGHINDDNDVLSTGQVAQPLKQWSFNPTEWDFIGRISSTTGIVDTIHFFINSNYPTTGLPDYITSLLGDTLLVVNNGTFYLFDLNCGPISWEKVWNPYPFDILRNGWLNNGDGKIIVSWPACAQNSGSSFFQNKIWTWINVTNGCEPVSGFATTDYLYFINANSYFLKAELATGDTITEYQPIPSYSYITGNKDLSVGYNISYLPCTQFDSIKIDTFGLPGGVPKSKIIKPGNSTNRLPSTNSYDDRTIMIYPNPAQNYFILKLTEQYLGRINSIELLNSLGSPVKKINGNPNYSTYKFDLTGYPEGVYFVNIKSECKTIRKKVIKME